MDGMPEHGPPEEHSASSSDAEPPVEIPEWAPLEPLPSSQMLLAAFDGKRSATATDILDPAFDLVACQTEYRLAFETLSDQSASAEQIRHAAAQLVMAHQDIEVLVAIIDDAVAERVKHCPVAQTVPNTAPVYGLPSPPVHTESIGEIAARMADLWDALAAKTGERINEDFPEAGQLLELCRGYDWLVAEIESGRRLLPGM